MKAEFEPKVLFKHGKVICICLGIVVLSIVFIILWKSDFLSASGSADQTSSIGTVDAGEKAQNNTRTDEQNKTTDGSGTGVQDDRQAGAQNDKQSTSSNVPQYTNADLQVPPSNPGLRDSNGNVHPIHSPNPVTGKTINVLDYGADPEDNSKDDRRAIQSALAAAKEGDEIYFPNGVYNLNSGTLADANANIRLKAGVNLRGESRDGVILKTSFDSKSGTNYAIIKGVGVHDIHISNMTLTSTWDRKYSTDTTINNPDGGGPSYGIYIGGLEDTPSYNITIENILVEKFKRSGITAAQSHDVVIRNCTIQNATDVGGGGAGYGITIQGQGHGIDTRGKPNDSYFNLVENCTTVGPYIRHSVLLQYYTHNNLVTNCNLYSILDSIDLHGEDEYNNEICYNYIHDVPRGAGVGLGNSGATHDATGPNNWIHHNVMENCNIGVTVEFGTPDTIIEHNEIKNAVKGSTFHHKPAGVQVKSASNVVIRENYIHDNTHPDFRAVFLTSGKAENDSPAGDPQNVQIVNNRIINCTNGIRIEAGTWTESGNEIQGCTGYETYYYKK